MSATEQRDQVSKLVKADPKKAHDEARRIKDPWFRAQALCWVLRFMEDDPQVVAKQASNAAQECGDQYKRTAVRAWQIAAMAERSLSTDARKTLEIALLEAKSVEPNSSKAEALILLLHAAYRLGKDDAQRVFEQLKDTCPEGEHWRCKRAIRDGQRIMSGELKPRPFFW